MTSVDDVDVGKPRLPWTAAGDGVGRATALGDGVRRRPWARGAAWDRRSWARVRRPWARGAAMGGGTAAGWRRRTGGVRAGAGSTAARGAGVEIEQ
jgi:hypothetical protein